MRLANMVIDAVDAALQDREISFDGVGMRVAANVFLDGMIDSLVAGEALADLGINGALVGAQIRLGRNFFFEDRLQIGGIGVRDMKDLTRPLRSTSATTGSWRGNFFAQARFFALPPTSVSSASTNLPSPPLPPGSL